MNRLTIIGNLTRDPVLRTTTSGQQVCQFTVAVNRPKTASRQDPGADFFNVSAWENLGVNCSKFLQKGRKVAVIGPVSVRLTTGNDGRQYANLDVTAREVEFLTPLSEVSPAAPPEPVPQPAPQSAAPHYQQQTYQDAMAGYTDVSGSEDDLPF